MRTIFFIAAIACSACGEHDVLVGDLQPVMVLPAIPNRDLDLLFVIDNSPSMADKQASLVASFPLMMDTLSTLQGGLPNLHIGVVTSDMGTLGSADNGVPGPTIGGGFPGGCVGVGDDGELQHEAPGVLTGSYIVDIGNTDGTRTQNYTGELRDVFGQIATVGEDGCGFEQHLAAMRRAIENPANDGFLRPSANLGVVILADEDDCSMTHSAMLAAPDDTLTEATLGPLQSFRCTRFGVTCDDGGVTTDDMNTPGLKSSCHARSDSAYVEDVTPFVDFLSNVKSDPRMVMVAAIAGDPTPVGTVLAPLVGDGTPIPTLANSCTFAGTGTTPEVADPAVRISQFVAGFPGRNASESICNGDLSLPLMTIGESAKQVIGDPCLTAVLADNSPAPGLQPLCEVRDGDGSDAATLPSCDDSPSGDCWSFVTDTASCPSTPTNLRFVVTRTTPLTTQRYTSVDCLTVQ